MNNDRPARRGAQAHRPAHWFRFHLGDVAQAVSRLNDAEELAFYRLLQLVHAEGGVLPADSKEVAVMLRMEDRAEVVEGALRHSRVFYEDGDATRCSICDDTLSTIEKRREAGRRNAEKRWKAMPTACESHGKRMPIACQPDANRMLSKIQDPRSSTQEPVPGDARGDGEVCGSPSEAVGEPASGPPDAPAEPKSKAARASKAPACPEDVQDGVWRDFLALRRQRKAPVTERVLRALRSEGKDCGLALNDVLLEMVVSGWQGFKAEWVLSRGRNSTRGGKGPSGILFGGPSSAEERKRLYNDDGGDPSLKEWMEG